MLKEKPLNVFWGKIGDKTKFNLSGKKQKLFLLMQSKL